ncbi:MAG TPA: hypothetical protein VIF40_06725 [Methylosinus sp.]|jgi:hypothetical protein|uniref:hypothetical protein n=1 Tax=Methylosinus sp. TaxID=427 RepID=UPI002F95DF76
MRTLVFLALLIVAGYLGWSRFDPSDSFRYRLILTAEVDGRLVSGTSVVQIDYRELSLYWLLPDDPGGPVKAKARGEALVLDLGAHGLLFATLDLCRHYPRYVVLDVVLCAWNGRPARSMNDLQAVRDLPPVELPFERLPMLVRFRDIADPETVERVEPEDLPAKFGPGVRLVGAKIEMTTDPVTQGITMILPWLARMRPKGNSLPRRFGQIGKPFRMLSYQDFLRPGE